MKYFTVDILERRGDYEFKSTIPYSCEDDVDIEKLSHQIAMESRGSDIDDWDESMQAYWWGDGVTFLPNFIEISETDYDVLCKYL